MKRRSKLSNERAFLSLEAMLAHLHPKEDAGALVRSLEDHFGSAGAMYRADPHMLEQLGVRPNDALLLKHLPELSRLTQRVQFEKRPRLAQLGEASEYLISIFHGLQVERFYLLCLDARGPLREQVLLQEGTSDSALFSLRRMLSEVVRTEADAVIIAHNHPGLTLRPSKDDILCTKEAVQALTAVGVPLLDHVIVAGKQAVSLRKNGFIYAGQWIAQAPDHPLLHGWLDDDVSHDFA